MRESRDRETFDFAEGKRVFRRGSKIFRGIFVFSGVKVLYAYMLFLDRCHFITGLRNTN